MLRSFSSGGNRISYDKILNEIISYYLQPEISRIMRIGKIPINLLNRLILFFSLITWNLQMISKLIGFEIDNSIIMWFIIHLFTTSQHDLFNWWWFMRLTQSCLVTQQWWEKERKMANINATNNNPLLLQHSIQHEKFSLWIWNSLQHLWIN